MKSMKVCFLSLIACTLMSCVDEDSTSQGEQRTGDGPDGSDVSCVDDADCPDGYYCVAPAIYPTPPGACVSACDAGVPDPSCDSGDPPCDANDPDCGGSPGSDGTTGEGTP
jgi:hypothetical protein